MNNQSLDRVRAKITEAITKLFAYGVDWTEYKDKSPNDHEVSTYAGKIKAEFAKTVADELFTIFNSELQNLRQELVSEVEAHLNSPLQQSWKLGGTDEKSYRMAASNILAIIKGEK